MKKVNIPALITTIIYFLCFFVLVFFVRKFNFAFWIVLFLIYGVPIMAGAYKGIRESNFFKKLWRICLFARCQCMPKIFAVNNVSGY